MRWVRRLLGLAIFVAVLMAGWQFAAANAVPVSVHYLVGDLEEVALWKVILMAVASGAAVVGFGWLWFAMKNGLVRRRYLKVMGGLEAEIHQLRNLPLAPEASAPGGSRAAVEEPPPGGALGRGA